MLDEPTPVGLDYITMREALYYALGCAPYEFCEHVEFVQLLQNVLLADMFRHENEFRWWLSNQPIYRYLMLYVVTQLADCPS